MSTDKFCPYCGKQNKADTQFCIQCNKDFIMIPYTKRDYFIYGALVIVISVFIFSVGLLGDRCIASIQNAVQRCNGSINGIMRLSFRAVGCVLIVV